MVFTMKISAKPAVRAALRATVKAKAAEADAKAARIAREVAWGKYRGQYEVSISAGLWRVYDEAARAFDKAEAKARKANDSAKAAKAVAEKIAA
jgi:hypothetical protein